MCNRIYRTRPPTKPYLAITHASLSVPAVCSVRRPNNWTKMADIAFESMASGLESSGKCHAACPSRVRRIRGSRTPCFSVWLGWFEAFSKRGPQHLGGFFFFLFI